MPIFIYILVLFITHIYKLYDNQKNPILLRPYIVQQTNIRYIYNVVLYQIQISPIFFSQIVFIAPSYMSHGDKSRATYASNIGIASTDPAKYPKTKYV